MVIVFGGIDFFVGFLVVLSVMVISVFMVSGMGFWFVVILLFGVVLFVGVFNGVLIVYGGMLVFVVMLGIFFGVCLFVMVFLDNKMMWEFGFDYGFLFWIGGGLMFGIFYLFYVLVLLVVIVFFVFKWICWG